MKMDQRPTLLLRGGGDLASGVALRLQRAGLRLVITELAQPLVVRRSVSFAEAVFQGVISVEGVTARRIDAVGEAGLAQIQTAWLNDEIPILVDPQAEAARGLQPLVWVDGRMIKQPPETDLHVAPLVIGLGPGFIAGANCHAVIETRRGAHLGRVVWQGGPEPDTGIPESVGNFGKERVLRAPVEGFLAARAQIGDLLTAGQPVAEVGGVTVVAPFAGVLRGLVHPGLFIQKGMKIGDVDPRADPQLCHLVSDKSLAVGGGVLEAILSRPQLRAQLWGTA